MNLLYLYFKEVLKSPILYVLISVTAIVLFLQGQWVVGEIPTNQQQYEKKLGFQNFKAFNKQDKQSFLKERTATTIVPVYEDNMRFDTRVSTTVFLANDHITEEKIKKFYEKIEKKGEIQSLKFLSVAQLNSLSEKEFKDYRNALYLPYGFGYSMFSGTYATKNYQYYINEPYQIIKKRIENKQEKISAPISRYFVRILSILLSISSAFLTIVFVSSDLATNRIRSFTMANVTCKKQICMRLISIFVSSIGISMIVIFPVVGRVFQQISYSTSMFDFLMYDALSVIVSILFSGIVSSIIVIMNKNLILSLFISLVFVIASSKGSEITTVSPRIIYSSSD
ncbi:hypothetical protein RyT2_29760 [Pseudolactococcus yaeyamensis]